MVWETEKLGCSWLRLENCESEMLGRPKLSGLVLSGAPSGPKKPSWLATSVSLVKKLMVRLAVRFQLALKMLVIL